MPTPEIRYRIEHHEYTTLQRFRLWWRNVVDALREYPPETYGEYIRVKEGEFGYDEAMFSETIIEGPRYRFENGEYVQVNPGTESSEPNPNWHDA